MTFLQSARFLVTNENKTEKSLLIIPISAFAFRSIPPTSCTNNNWGHFSSFAAPSYPVGSIALAWVAEFNKASSDAFAIIRKRKRKLCRGVYNRRRRRKEERNVAWTGMFGLGQRKMRLWSWNCVKKVWNFCRRHASLQKLCWLQHRKNSEVCVSRKYWVNWWV